MVKGEPEGSREKKKKKVLTVTGRLHPSFGKHYISSGSGLKKPQAHDGHSQPVRECWGKKPRKRGTGKKKRKGRCREVRFVTYGEVGKSPGG